MFNSRSHQLPPDPRYYTVQHNINRYNIKKKYKYSMTQQSYNPRSDINDSLLSVYICTCAVWWFKVGGWLTFLALRLDQTLQFYHRWKAHLETGRGARLTNCPLLWSSTFDFLKVIRVVESEAVHQQAGIVAKIGRTSPTLTSKSKMVSPCINSVKAVVMSCLLAVFSHILSTVQCLSVDMLLQWLYVQNIVKYVFVLVLLSMANLFKTVYLTSWTGMLQTMLLYFNI